MKKTRRRFKQTTTFRSRVETFASDLREQAEKTQNATIIKQLVLRAQKADTAIDIDEWVSGNKGCPELLQTRLTKIS